MLEFFIDKGADIRHPPETVSKVHSEKNKESENYRKAPFIIQAASAGSIDAFKFLLQKGLQINEDGFVCFSRKRKNQVISNVIGAAAYHGHSKLVKQLMKSTHILNMDLGA